MRDNRDHRRDVRDHRRDHVRDNRNRHVRERYRGTIRANRRAITRRPLHVSNGRFTFHNGHHVVYNRPVIRERFYNVRIRPTLIVEDFPAQHGYIWVSGNWNWNGYEWQWTSGHYAPDPSYQTYYDDGSYDVYDE